MACWICSGDKPDARVGTPCRFRIALAVRRWMPYRSASSVIRSPARYRATRSSCSAFPSRRCVWVGGGVHPRTSGRSGTSSAGRARLRLSRCNRGADGFDRCPISSTPCCGSISPATVSSLRRPQRLELSAQNQDEPLAEQCSTIVETGHRPPVRFRRSRYGR